jgi:hypothetical protein
MHSSKVRPASDNMRAWPILLLMVLTLAGCKPARTKPLNPEQYKPVEWIMLIPEAWDPMRGLKNLDLSKLKDSDPQAIQAMADARKLWDKAPIEPKMNGKNVRITGFVAPLDNDLGHVKEFLLVPFFGQCIHVPPPPSNQVIYVQLDKPVSLKGWDGSVNVSGMLQTAPLSLRSVSPVIACTLI